MLWRKFRRWVYNSRVSRYSRELRYRLYEWWYPPAQVSAFDYPGYHHRRLSRPVLAYRRWRRWFQKTWVGREFGWVLDEVAFLLSFPVRQAEQVLAERRIQKFLSRRQNIGILIVLGLVLVAAYNYSIPHYRRYLERQYARQAEQFMMKGDMARAYLRARQAAQLNPQNVTACRVNADLADWANSPFAVYWRRRTALLAPTVTNRLALASTALRAEPFPYPTAANTLEEIEPEFRQTASYHMVAGALAIKLNSLSEAERHYAEALKLQPDNPVTRMSLAVVHLQSKDPQIVADSRITLELLNADGKLGMLPLRSLVAESAVARDFARAERLSNQLLTNAQASFSDRMVHLSILHASKGTNFRSFLKETQEKASQQPVYIGELAAWLNQRGFASDALTWLQGLPRQVAGQGLVPVVLADSYIALRKWNELVTYLEAERWIGQDHIRMALLAFALRNQSGKQDSGSAWNRAVRLAADAPTALNTLAQLALSWGWMTEAEQVLWHAADKFPSQAWPLTSLQRVYTARRDTTGLRRLCQTLMEKDPKDKFARNNFAMLSLLTGKDLPTAQRIAAELHTADPGSPVFASTYAFSLHLQGKTKEGLEVLRALKAEELANPAVAVYYGILLSAAGEVQTSRDYLGKSDKAFLLPEELALVTSARKLN